MIPRAHKYAADPARIRARRGWANEEYHAQVHPPGTPRSGHTFPERDSYLLAPTQVSRGLESSGVYPRSGHRWYRSNRDTDTSGIRHSPPHAESRPGKAAPGSADTHQIGQPVRRLIA